MDGFEGYVGIRVGDQQMFNDVVFSLLFVLLIVFAFVFRANYHLFMKMIRDVFYVKDRVSLFDDMGGNETVLLGFMIFQALYLSSLSFFIAGHSFGYIPDYDTVEMNLLVFGGIFLVLFLFYLFKQLLYNFSGLVFAGPDLYKTWRTGYAATIGFWGILMYFPVLSLAFTEMRIQIPCYILIALFLLCRLVIVYKTILLFNTRGIGFLYIILYLCGQEIMPLIFLYEGFFYLYNYY
ncbi:MAG: DUF4271 domain-containing protein [Tannerellaceae bacterium]|jgi:hypothetical protein|nr:DUF4271 domain-containing protein [Tannerellaceae bacterium]